MKPFICKRLGWWMLVITEGVTLHDTLDAALVALAVGMEPTC